MIKDIQNLIGAEIDKVSKYSIEQDRMFNKYIVLGCAASLTLIINLLSKNRSIFDKAEYMSFALWGFAFAIILSTACIFLNARLSDFALNRYATLQGFLVGYKSDPNGEEELDDEAMVSFREIYSKNEGFLKWSRRIVIFLEVFAGFIFCSSIFISIFEVSKIL